MFEEFFSGAEAVFALNLLLSLAMGYIIGAERESKGKSAGISTQCLVIAGSMTFSYLSSLMINDPARIAAGIVTGVGFLGAGIIFHQSKDKVVNLTTAATLWLAAGIGMALGFGYYVIAISAALFAIIALRIPHMGKIKK
ncbi:MAG: MgtC/SapB family protein [Candidatus Micrarchaeota archaeon]